MTTAIAVEDVRREVKILRALSGHPNLVHFYEAYEDDENVYIVMEWVSTLINYSPFNRHLISIIVEFIFSDCAKEESC